jgi:hypothetical protein|tara:strand:- start:3952 stop:4668 length:717 start_codon:yes stop_codon:yes gene_type:complete
MLSFIGSNSYFIPNVHKNSVSTKNLNEVVKDDFTFNVRIKPEWSRCGQNHHDSYGVIALNGMDLGIFLRKDEQGNYNINAEFWIDNENPKVKLVQLVSGTDFELDEWLNISLVFKKNKSMTLICNSSMNRVSFEDDLVDYGSSWLWIGCANNRWNVDGALWRNYIGKIKRIGVFNKALSKKEINKFFENYEKKDNETTDPFFITTKFRRTRYKVFDESYTGNHLCKNIYNTDGRNLMF